MTGPVGGDDDLWFNFGEEDKEAAGQSRGRSQLRLPTATTRRRRLGLLAGVALLLVVIVAVSIGGCGAAAQSAEARYLERLSGIAADSQATGRRLQPLLARAGSSKPALRAALAPLVAQARAELARARALTAPDSLQTAQNDALNALSLRLSGLLGIQTALLRQTARSTITERAVALSPAIARLAAADVVWSDIFETNASNALATEKAQGVTVPNSVFLADHDLATTAALAKLLGGGTGVSKAAAASGATLKLGDHGPAVTTWQTELNRWVHLTAPAQAESKPDGIFGAATEALTRQFQLGHALSPDGTVGPLTWKAMAHALDSATAGSASTNSRSSG